MRRKSERVLAVAAALLLAASVFCTGEKTAVAADVPGCSSAAAYVLMESESGRVLASKNPHTKLPMASTTKVMTCLPLITL